MNGESTSMVWPTLGSRTAEEQNRKSVIDSDGMIRPRCTTMSRCGGLLLHASRVAWSVESVCLS